MGVMKLSKSRKQVQFICDEGVVYCTSLAYLQGLLNSSRHLLLFQKYEDTVSKDRFATSAIYNPSGYLKDREERKTTGNDAFSTKAMKEGEQARNYSEKDIKW